jgi:carboxypeptidase Q
MASPIGESGCLTATDVRTAAVIRDRSRAGGRAYEFARELATRIGPRLAGSPADAEAVAWAAAQMRSLKLANVRLQEVEVPKWERGTAEVSVLTPKPISLAVVALGGSIGTPDRGIQASVVEVTDTVELRSKSRADLREKIVFVNTVTERTKDSSGYLHAVSSRMDSASIAQSLGAVAVLIRSIGTSSGPNPHTGIVRYKDHAERIPAFALSAESAEALSALLKEQANVQVSVRSSAHEEGMQRSANVIAEIEGSTTKNEIVLLGAHLDSWDLGQGAADDAAGVGIVMGVASAFASKLPRPRRTIRFVLFANEENGLSGSKVYAASATREKVRHEFALEADSGAAAVWALQTETDQNTRVPIKAILDMLHPYTVISRIGQMEGSADLDALRPSGVVLVGLNQDRSHYFDVHHSADDVIAHISAAALSQAESSYAATVWLLAQCRAVNAQVH